ncbi:MAG: undecaprenyldiphospho-muramoylpentapeptide beta-N-acetylglucosaminyltransferase [Clostridia bacterium]|nr:undecaprenyldiphospho-muramoylpentapeptide beta-N-acetylglucosaminyltransferase [Clostridia bacterium]
MRIILSGGGTGGHINPALAIAREVQKREPDSAILFCGGTGGLEEKLVPREGFELKTFTVHGFRRKLTPSGILYNIKALSESQKAMRQAKQIIRDFKPDVVVGCGGYASYPIVKAAQTMNVPTALLEVNAYPGMTTKTLAGKCRALMICFEKTREYFPNAPIVMTGSPVRDAFTTVERESARRALGLDERPLVVSVWGSLGAERMNHAMVDFIAEESREDRHQLIHAIGSYGYTWVRDDIAKAGVDLKKHPNIQVMDYIYNMPEVMAAADLILCRGGAATLAELAFMGKPAIIVPSPNVAENHQEKNARALEAGGGAVVLLDSDADGKTLYKMAEELLSQPEKLDAMGKAMKTFATRDAIGQIYDCIRRIAAK